MITLQHKSIPGGLWPSVQRSIDVNPINLILNHLSSSQTKSLPSLNSTFPEETRNSAVSQPYFSILEQLKDPRPPLMDDDEDDNSSFSASKYLDSRHVIDSSRPFDT